jgi:hypothetical protein
MKFTVERVADVTIMNSVFVYRRALRLNLVVTAAVYISTVFWPSPTRDAHRSGILQACGVLAKHSSTHDVWLVAGHSGTQPDSAVPRNRALWKSLRLCGVERPDGDTIPEHAVTLDGGLRFFAAVKLDWDNIEAAFPVLEVGDASTLVLLKRSSEALVAELVRKGWDNQPYAPDPAIVTAALSADGVVFVPIGFFDDRECGVAVLGSASLLSHLS